MAPKASWLEWMSERMRYFILFFAVLRAGTGPG
jgi:hypothetical protein